jgi:predicted DNA-binding protein
MSGVKGRSGGKPKYNQTMTEQIAIRFTSEQFQKLNEVSNNTGKTVTEVIRDSVNNHLKKAGNNARSNG